ncbi:uncharacterized protein MYCFIDRAFT_33048 [Pseudocercospora fijiensis CIRAD86]|uniref:Thioredoxin domain-containing protein n=1 Tax=Pseudocercospora fijiensis (strain CIRAD86) TaxID=383855 RepID=N1QD38_PSEFD|nr:uncharacterized protein MYCFIDRAFT_33048 [Pseudocercospora fijiensis CIRAD86]EME89708.1 hypothetical protein MYCFIDRAFT_33048 [Pseudocercospora fijiensis CIRAD86]
MEEISDFPQYLKASNADGTHILEATAPWCSQCKAIAPFVEKLTKKYPEARFYNYNTDTALQIAQELGANQMPTFHIFKDGELKDSITGAHGKKLEEAVAKNYDGRVEDVE